MINLGEILDDPKLTPRQKAKLSLEAERILGKNNLYYLLKEILGYKDLTEDFHKPICDTLNYYRSSWQFHLHPRGHFKSTIITIAETIQDLLINPNDTILITNAVLGNSVSFLKEIKSHFIHNDKFRKLYPEYCPSNSAEEGNQESFTTPARQEKWIRESSIEISGIDKSIVSRHYNKITFDDVVNNLNVSTQEQREKIINSFKEHLSLLNPGGRIRVVGTRWHYYELYGFILDEIMRERRANKEPMFKMFITKAYKDDGTPVFPSRFTPEVLDGLKKLQGAYVFGCQYMNDPQPEEEKIFSRKDIRFIAEPICERNQRLFYFCSTDPSVSEKERSDPSVIITIAVNGNKDIFITDIVREWFNPDQFIDSVLFIAQKVQPIKFGMETVSFQKTLKFFLDKARLERKIHLNIIEVKRSAHISKADRIKRIQPYLKAGQVFLCADPNNLTETQRDFLEELDTFPYGRYDDILDALADAIEIHHAPTNRTRYKIQYEKIDNSPYGTGYRHRAILVPFEERYPTLNGVSG